MKKTIIRGVLMRLGDSYPVLYHVQLHFAALLSTSSSPGPGCLKSRISVNFDYNFLTSHRGFLFIVSAL